jgi:hypothetical protein
LHKSHGDTPAAMFHDEKGGRSSHGNEVRDASIRHALVLIVIVTVIDRDPTPSSSEAFVISWLRWRISSKRMLCSRALCEKMEKGLPQKLDMLTSLCRCYRRMRPPQLSSMLAAVTRLEVMTYLAKRQENESLNAKILFTCSLYRMH